MYSIITTCSVECYWHCSDGTVHYKSDKMVNFCSFRCATMSPITVFINVVFTFIIIISQPRTLPSPSSSSSYHHHQHQTFLSNSSSFLSAHVSSSLTHAECIQSNNIKVQVTRHTNCTLRQKTHHTIQSAWKPVYVIRKFLQN